MQNPARETVLSALRVDLLALINLILKTLHRQAQSFVSKVILDPAKFTVNINYHICYLPGAYQALI